MVSAAASTPAPPLLSSFLMNGLPASGWPASACATRSSRRRPLDAAWPTLVRTTRSKFTRRPPTGAVFNQEQALIHYTNLVNSISARPPPVSPNEALPEEGNTETRKSMPPPEAEEGPEESNVETPKIMPPPEAKEGPEEKPCSDGGGSGEPEAPFTPYKVMTMQPLHRDVDRSTMDDGVDDSILQSPIEKQPTVPQHDKIMDGGTDDPMHPPLKEQTTVPQHDTDTGEKQEKPSNKKRRQKMKRRRIRPRVVLDDKPTPRTPKPTIPKPVTSKKKNDQSSPKRRYVRKKKKDLNHKNSKSVKRTLNFDPEGDAKDESPVSTTTDAESTGKPTYEPAVDMARSAFNLERSPESTTSPPSRLSRRGSIQENLRWLKKMTDMNYLVSSAGTPTPTPIGSPSRRELIRGFLKRHDQELAYSNCQSEVILLTEGGIKLIGLKRDRSHNGLAYNCYIDVSGDTQFIQGSNCHEMDCPAPHCTEIHKKRRTDNREACRYYNQVLQHNQRYCTFAEWFLASYQCGRTTNKASGLPFQNYNGSSMAPPIIDHRQILLDHYGKVRRSDVQESLHASHWSGAIVPYVKPIGDKLESLNLSQRQVDTPWQPHNALVPYDNVGMMVPYFDPIKIPQKKVKAKVQLDPETKKEWKLLMGGKEARDKNNETDPEKVQYWEKERELFRGRALSFIARMHVIQGNRSFSRWGGSVVDSVVGVFLTQNVSDHLSSSAFMHLAAMFPARPIGKNGEPDSEKMNTSAEPRKESISTIDDTAKCQEKMLSREECDKDFVAEYEAKDLEKKETSDVSISLGNGIEGVKDKDFSSQKVPSDMPKVTSGATASKKTEDITIDWDELRRGVECNFPQGERSSERLDAVNWEAVLKAGAAVIAKIIQGRGMSNILGGRILEFLKKTKEIHGSIDLEWLRMAPPDKVKDYLLSMNGLGLKSTECVRLLSLEQHAFPVDTNVGRIFIRLGWVPLENLPDLPELHLLDRYPYFDTIQKYVWTRLNQLGGATLYLLHYHMITFGKVFCTKKNPNCNQCPMRGECKHFASEVASTSTRLLTRPEEKNVVRSVVTTMTEIESDHASKSMPHLQHEGTCLSQGTIYSNCSPIIEEPATPELEQWEEALEMDIEDYDDPDEIPYININEENPTQDILEFSLANNLDHAYDGLSKAVISLSEEFASSTMAKQTKTQFHLVYELPDGHSLLKGVEQRVCDDPSPYLFAIWDETAKLTESSETCHAETVSGTLLIPCRTAMRGSFPLNGTYFQVNEVFADHASSCVPLCIQRECLSNLNRRFLYVGKTTTSIFKGMRIGMIQHCFWAGFICVRGFDRETRRPTPLRGFLPVHKGTKSKKPQAKKGNAENSQRT